MNNEKLIREYNELGTLKESNPEEFKERSAKLLEELESCTDQMKANLIINWKHLAETAKNVSLAGGFLYVRKDPEWRERLLKEVTVGPYIWAEGGHIYHAYITADIVDGSARERLKRRTVFTKDWVPTNITPLNNSIARLKEEVEESHKKTYRYKVELTEAGPYEVKAIKVVRKLLGLGLKESYDIVRCVPSTLLETNAKEEADYFRTMLEEINAKVTIWDENERRPAMKSQA